MICKTISVVFMTLIFVNYGLSQESSKIIKGFEIQDLKSNVTGTISFEDNNKKINTSLASSKKSPFLALLFSLVIPGSGHLYLNRMDVGKYYFGVDVASWMGYGTLTVYGNDVFGDAKTFSNQHAAVTNINNKDDDYFANVGNYFNIYDYNNAQLAIGNYSGLYNVNEYFWNWDNVNNQNIFETQRKNSERIYNSRIIFGSILVANRIVAGISAYLIASKDPKKTSALNVQPELLYKNDFTFDGVKINLSRNF
jgi:hypothetical protein